MRRWLILPVLIACGWGASAWIDHSRRVSHMTEAVDAPWVAGSDKPGQAITIVFIGDSITGLAAPQGTAAQICAADLSESSGRPVRVLRCYRGGSTTANWLPGGPLLNDAAAKIETLHPQTISVMLGTNDALAGVGPRDYVEHLRQIVSALAASGATVVVDLPSATRDQIVNARLLAYRDSWGGLSRGDTKAFDAFLSNPALLRSDGVHPADAGVVKLGHLWADAIKAPAPSSSSSRYRPAGTP